MSKVFVCSENIKERYNIDDLSRLGEVVFLYASKERMPSVYNLEVFASSIVQRLDANHFDAENDCIAMVGRQIEIAMVFYVAGLLIGSIDVAFFDSVKASFVRKSIEQNAIPDFTTVKTV